MEPWLYVELWTPFNARTAWPAAMACDDKIRKIYVKKKNLNILPEMRELSKNYDYRGYTCLIN